MAITNITKCHRYKFNDLKITSDLKKKLKVKRGMRCESKHEKDECKTIQLNRIELCKHMIQE